MFAEMLQIADHRSIMEYMCGKIFPAIHFDASIRINSKASPDHKIYLSIF